MQLVLASNNAHKLRELQVLLAPLGLAIVAQSTLGVSEAEEPHVSFVENALAKARHAAGQAGRAAIADDSGLCVDALGGAPGVLSARYAVLDSPSPSGGRSGWGSSSAATGDHPNPAPAGEGVGSDREAQRRRQDAANNALLLERLAGADSRRARFVCALVAVRSADDPEPLIAMGRWHGEILDAPRGAGGFGYDPLMFIPALGRCVAELSADEKNRHSHRAIAVQQMIGLMREVWRSG